jgi:hypothetical protein
VTVVRLYLCPAHGIVEHSVLRTVFDPDGPRRRRTVRACPLVGCDMTVTGPSEYVRLTEALDAARTIAADRGHPQPRRERDLIERTLRRPARQRKDTPA